MLTRDLKRELGSKKKQKMKELYEKYRVKRKGLKTVIEELAVSEQSITERQNGCDDRSPERVSISVEKTRNNAERYQIRKPQGETVSMDIGSRTSAV